MPRAIIVIGHEIRFLQAAESFRTYLASAHVAPVRMIRTAYFLPNKLEEEIARQLAVAAGETLFIAYFGHGWQNAWAYSLYDQHTPICLGYDRVAALLAHREAATLLLNECCYAGSIIPALEDAGADLWNFSLIAASSPDEVSRPGMAERVIESWKARRVHQPFMEITPLYPRPPWRLRLKVWWQKRKTSLMARLFPRTHPIPPSIPPFPAVRECRWGAEIDHYFFPKP